MTELMSIKETMSSLQIAEITEKRHDAVLRDIRNLLDQGVGAHNFVESSYNNSQNKELPCFILTKKGCLILASGYNALLREKIINRWEELELQHRNGGFQIPQTLSEALMLAAEQTKQLEQAKAEKQLLEAKAHEQERVIQEQAPKVEYYDDVLNSTSTYTATQIAKEFGWGAETLNRKLKEKGVQYKQSGQWLLYAKYQDKGYTRTVTRSYTGTSGKIHTSQQTVWTEPGRQFIHSLFD
jgi:Rha family phage regulatory protein